MGTELSRGTQIPTMFGATATVKRMLGGGGQGDVYVVDYNGMDKALKWYSKGNAASNTLFMENLRSNVMNGSPKQEFLWPIDMTQPYNGTFGYVMDLAPKGFYEATEFFLYNVHFSSFKVAVDACLKIVSAFLVLHNDGYCYQDVSGGNFFINPTTGEVLICDNDNVVPNGHQTGILGTPRYMAPEIVRGDTTPNVHSDLYSIAVVIFMLLCMAHPLEGRRSLVPALTEEMQLKLYGTEPLFVMDPDNTDNRPDTKIHRNLMAVWTCLPEHLRELMLQAFSQDSLMHPSHRPTEADWVRALARFRSEIVSCSCGNEVFAQYGAPRFCEKCGQKISVPTYLKLSGYALPCMVGTRIYKCQTCVCNFDEVLDTVAAVVASPTNPQMLGVMNVSGGPWEAMTTTGQKRVVESGAGLPAKEGIAFRLNNETVEIVNN